MKCFIKALHSFFPQVYLIKNLTMMNAQTKASQDAITPAKALELLKEGNQRFSAKQKVERDLNSLNKPVRAISFCNRFELYRLSCPSRIGI